MRLKLLELLKLLICRCFLSLPRLLSGTFVNHFEQRRRRDRGRQITPGRMRLARCDFSFGSYSPQAFSGLRASADLGGHPVFDQPDNRRQDRAGDAAACELANECADVHGASRLRK